jgi:hypothetical protein
MIVGQTSEEKCDIQDTMLSGNESDIEWDPVTEADKIIDEM